MGEADRCEASIVERINISLCPGTWNALGLIIRPLGYRMLANCYTIDYVISILYTKGLSKLVRDGLGTLRRNIVAC